MGDIDLGTVDLLFNVLVVCIGAAFTLYARALARRAATEQQVGELKQELALAASKDDVKELENRVARAEARLEDTPTVRAIHELAIALERFGGDLKATTARLDGVGEVIERLDRVVSRQEDFLLNKGAVK